MKKLRTILLILFAPVAMIACNGPEVAEETSAPVADSTHPGPKRTIIVDVRTVEEWNNDGHAGCSVNYPLNELDKKTDSLKGYDSIILVCRSGNRAGQAKEMLEKAGFKGIENKGPWQNIDCK